MAEPGLHHTRLRHCHRLASTAPRARSRAGIPGWWGRPPPAPAFRCWDGSGAEEVSQCSLPDGLAGLAWVFPDFAQQKCGAPTQTGPGVMLRILCVDRLADGTRVRLGYYQWKSVRNGIVF